MAESLIFTHNVGDRIVYFRPDGALHEEEIYLRRGFMGSWYYHMANDDHVHVDDVVGWVEPGGSRMLDPEFKSRMRRRIDGILDMIVDAREWASSRAGPPGSP